VLKKIRRMLALQGLMWSAAMYFGWKNREAIERSVRAARAAWNEVGRDGAVEVDELVVAMVATEPSTGAVNLDSALVDAMPSAAEVAQPF
jgi:hypothetical protein